MFKIQICLIAILNTILCLEWHEEVKATSLNSELYDQLVGGRNHVVIFYFAPWCGHSKAMAIEWNQVYSYYHEKDDTRKDVLIAKFNCQQDDYQFCKQNDIKSFPTIKFVPAGIKQSFSKYEGERKLYDFVKWIEDNASKFIYSQESALSEQEQEIVKQQEQSKQSIQQQENKQPKNQIDIEQFMQKKVQLKQQHEYKSRTKRENEERQQIFVMQRKKQIQ